MLKNDFDFDVALSNLYRICLQYFSLLKEKEHPMIKHITDVMDLLIDLKKTEKERDLEENTKTFDKIHNIAYKNIEDIFNYDQKQDKEKGINTEPQKL
jgi:hypothetical protein